ncbi:DeoR/GlpR family DNA-binding transcription regulator [Vibrio sp. SS-MA-C1-2]|uniref:DeoR/GlpR family DNA-binding transcription regulator n=1 Tax=Vibrio sp. SS-MA-C1-2 TaxID=2908646 RepID=UPI001F21D935|nr:DeoR/GlpR family DNA-binding transcription regulator [Vibrio sp. SS-MA-C1-2]UJF18290.1 DeoR/GlpR family DNA-binding transcription regulator [Vibrio sp. SS-MA-C1-2]
MKRNTNQRREAIVKRVNSSDHTTVADLTRYFSTSEVTIRKDLTELEKQNKLIRKHGGAIPIPNSSLSANFIVEQKQVSKRKLELSDLANSLIKEKSRIIIDSGNTTAGLIDKLNNKKGLVVMTNSLIVANKIDNLAAAPTLLMTGGTWDSQSNSFQGKVAESVLRAYDFDQLFIGADGVDLSRGTTTYNELIGLSQVMAEVAKQVIVMIESDKIGYKIPNLELAWSNIDILITNSDITEHQRQEIESHNVTVITA